MGGIVAGALFLFTILSPMPTSTPSKHISSPSPSKTPTSTPKPPSPTPANTVHIVESGETLYTIADKYYGSEKYWINLWNDNDFIDDPRIIRNGWTLKISTSKPTNIEEPSEKLAKVYETLTSPSPTPTPEVIKEVATASIPQGPTGSFDEVYKQAGARYGVPWEILYGLHFMETGLRDGAISSGYGTGAQGPLQFMPGTWNIYGVDGNGDGAVDINNAVDAIHGAANYLVAHGGVEQGLKSYGGDSEKAKEAARSRGYSQ